MFRQIAAVACLILAAACGGGGASSPTTPSAANQTRIIGLSGNLAFGTVDVNTTREAALNTANTGNATLNISGMTGPSGYTVSSTTASIPAGGSVSLTVRFSPTEGKTYNGTITVNGDQTSGVNTIAIFGTGVAPLFSRSGTGDNVFDMPTSVSRIHITGTYRGNSSNFIVKVGGRLLVNELLGTAWPMTTYDGTLLTTGGVVEITNSSGVAWSFTEVR